MNVKTIAALAAVLALTAWAYLDLLAIGFTAADTFALIEAGRCESWSELLGRAFEPLMAGSAFEEHHRYWRPVAGWTFGLDWSLWGLDPAGYHASDVLIHLANVALVFALVSQLTGKRATAAVAALLFGLHPIHEASVPAIARRQDTLAAGFVLLSLLLYFRSARAPGRSRALALLSHGAFALALGCKESAILLPVLVFAGAWIFSSTPPQGRQWRLAARAALPYGVLALLYLSIRAWVLQGSDAAAASSLSAVERAQFAAELPYLFVRWLLDPGLALGTASQPALRFGLPAVLLAWMAVASRRKAPGRASLAALTFAAACALALALPRALPSLLRSAGASRYHVEAFAAALPAGALAGLLAAFGAWWWLARERPQPETPHGKTVRFGALWLGSSLVLLLATFTLAPRNLYLPAVPLSALLAIFLVKGLVDVARSLRGAARPASWMRAAVPLGLAALSIAQSPLFSGHDKWRESARCSQLFLDRLERAVADLPAGATLRIRGVPALAVRDAVEEHAALVSGVGAATGNVTGLTDYSIAAWLELKRPGTRHAVVVESFARCGAAPREVEIGVETLGELEARLSVQVLE